jgi:uncharacterized protein YxjI
MSNLTPISPQYAASGPTTLVFKEKKTSLSGDSGKVHDADGNLMFKIDAKLMTMSDRRIVKDAKGADIGQIRKKKTPGLHDMWYVGTMDDDKKCAVKSKGMMNITKCDADIYLGGTVIGEASGNWRAKSFKISIGGNQVAEVSRKTGLASILLDADSYSIEISAGVDAAFITMIVIALDEIYHDDD